MEQINAGRPPVDVTKINGLADLLRVKTVQHPNPSNGVCFYCGYPILKNQSGIQNLKFKAHLRCFQKSGDDQIGGALMSPPPGSPEA